jgi:hypothetical protein
MTGSRHSGAQTGHAAADYADIGIMVSMHTNCIHDHILQIYSNPRNTDTVFFSKKTAAAADAGSSG